MSSIFGKYTDPWWTWPWTHIIFWRLILLPTSRLTITSSSSGITAKNQVSRYSPLMEIVTNVSSSKTLYGTGWSISIAWDKSTQCFIWSRRITMSWEMHISIIWRGRMPPSMKLYWLERHSNIIIMDFGRSSTSCP